MLATSHTQGYASVLIAGAGDVGTRLARQLAASGHRVFALRRGEAPGATPDARGATPDAPGATSDARAGARPGEAGLSAVDGITWLRGDMTRPGTLAGLPAVDALVHLATPDAREEAAYRAVYLDGLRHVVEALPARPRRTVFVSSSAVYGDHGGAWVDETTPTDPPGFNGRVLRDTEQWLASQDIGGVSVRLAGLYGPGRTQLFERLREGKVSVPRGQGVYANRIHVDDAASALAHVLGLEAAESLYVGVDDMPLPIDELYDHLAGLLGAPLPPSGPGPAGVGNKRLSNARLKASGFRCRWPDACEGYAALL